MSDLRDRIAAAIASRYYSKPEVMADAVIVELGMTQEHGGRLGIGDRIQPLQMHL